MARVQTEEQRNSDAQRAAQLLGVLQKHATSRKSKLNPTRIAAAKVALPFLRPMLSAVDQTLHMPDDVLSEAEAVERLMQVIDAHPDLLDKLIELRAARARVVSDVQAPPIEDAVQQIEHPPDCEQALTPEAAPDIVCDAPCV